MKNFKACVILFPILVFLMVFSVVVSMIQAAVFEIQHWLPEFVTTWRFVKNV